MEARDESTLVKTRRLPLGRGDVDEQAGRNSGPLGAARHFGDDKMPQLDVVGVTLDDHRGPFLAPGTSRVRNAREHDIAPSDGHGAVSSTAISSSSMASTSAASRSL